MDSVWVSGGPFWSCYWYVSSLCTFALWNKPIRNRTVRFTTQSTGKHKVNNSWKTCMLFQGYCLWWSNMKSWIPDWAWLNILSLFAFPCITFQTPKHFHILTQRRVSISFIGIACHTVTEAHNCKRNNGYLFYDYSFKSYH